MEKDAIILTMAQAINAIELDFRQYAPQTLLFCSLIELISKNKIHFQRTSGKYGVWISQAGHQAMRWLSGDQLIEFMCKAIRETHWESELLTTVCRRVFQSRASSFFNKTKGQHYIRIETDMSAFHCRQCGCCCRNLDYRYEVCDEDVTNWKALDRRDILEWVEPVFSKNRVTGYRVWVNPGTGKRAETCPFLEKHPTHHQWRCRIHTVKPQICQNYPTSQKHAIMTGCPGFNPIKSIKIS